MSVHDAPLDFSLTPLQGRRRVRPPVTAAPHDISSPAVPAVTVVSRELLAELAPPPPAPPVGPALANEPALSRGLAQVLNAALIDSSFCAAFLASPATAARRAALSPERTFGTTLPDAVLRLDAPAVTEAELALLGCLAPPTSLAGAARDLMRLSAEATWTDSSPGADRVAYSGSRRRQAARNLLSAMPAAPTIAPASYEGRLAGAA
ncbi:MAG TPA: hypothetical protein VFX49_08655 [Chloroflexota bacterium]|nr:hypothetical protein [Chloroflexota bacterium]